MIRSYGQKAAQRLLTARVARMAVSPPGALSAFAEANTTRLLLSRTPLQCWFSSSSGIGNTDSSPSSKSTDEGTAEPLASEESATTDGIATEPPDAGEAADLSSEEKLQGEVKDLKDQLLRSLAEQENIRGIAKRDVASARQFAIQSFAKSLLEVSDHLSLALLSAESTTQDDTPDNAAAVLHTLVQGIQMTEKGLLKAFTKNGLIKYGEVGEEFNPNLHEALYEYVDPSQTPGTVGQVMKNGFMLNERVLRPAEVGVVKKE